MKQILITLFIFSFLLNMAFAQDGGTPKQGTDSTTPPSSGLESLLSYNFVNNNASISNFTPQIYYGWTRTYGQTANLFSGMIEVGPYTSTQLDASKADSYLPGLMMQGNFGVIANHYFVLNFGDHKIYLSPVNLGLKVLPGFTESAKTVIQTNIRTSFTYQYLDFIAVTAQFTDAWHNITSDSQSSYEQIFNTSNTNIKYMMVTIQTKVGDIAGSKTTADASLPTYLVIQWRNFLTEGNTYSGLANRKFLTFGFKVGLNLKTGAAATAKRTTTP